MGKDLIMNKDYLFINKIQDFVTVKKFGGLMKDAIFLIAAAKKYLAYNEYTNEVINNDVIPIVIYFHVFYKECINVIDDFIDDLNLVGTQKKLVYDILDDINKPSKISFDTSYSRAILYALAVKELRFSKPELLKYLIA